MKNCCRTAGNLNRIKNWYGIQRTLTSKTAFDKADTPEKVEMIESSLLELIKTSVDLNFGSHLENINTLTKQDIETIQKNAIQDIWGEWEDHVND